MSLWAAVVKRCKPDDLPLDAGGTGMSHLAAQKLVELPHAEHPSSRPDGQLVTAFS